MNQLRDQLASIANTNYQGSPVFGGFGTTAVQQTSPGVYSYVGGSGNVQRQVAPNTTVTVNVDGSQVFGFSAGAGKDVFSVLTTLSNAAAAGDSATLTSALKDLNNVQDNVYTAQEQVGSKTQQVSALQSLLQSQTTDLEQVRSNLQDVDEAKSVLDLQSAQTAYQAALTAAAQGNLPSLASYLK
jgi:flagellar hook-associated protein 3 FlgL